MHNNNNATCKICGKGYYTCLSCKEQQHLSPWKLYTDTSEHFKIFQIIHGFSTGVYTKNEAKQKLNKVDLSDMKTFKDSIKEKINEIQAENAKKDLPKDSSVCESYTKKDFKKNEKVVEKNVIESDK